MHQSHLTDSGDADVRPTAAHLIATNAPRKDGSSTLNGLRYRVSQAGIAMLGAFRDELGCAAR